MMRDLPLLLLAVGLAWLAVPGGCQGDPAAQICVRQSSNKESDGSCPFGFVSTGPLTCIKARHAGADGGSRGRASDRCLHYSAAWPAAAASRCVTRRRQQQHVALNSLWSAALVQDCSALSDYPNACAAVCIGRVGLSIDRWLVAVAAAGG